MKVFVPALILMCVALAADAGADAGVDAGVDAGADDLPGGECLECHLTTEDGVGELWQEDVHAHAGITCDACHGGTRPSNLTHQTVQGQGDCATCHVVTAWSQTDPAALHLLLQFAGPGKL